MSAYADVVSDIEDFRPQVKSEPVNQSGEGRAMTVNALVESAGVANQSSSKCSKTQLRTLAMAACDSALSGSVGTNTWGMPS